MFQILFIHPDQKLTQLYLNHIKPHFAVDSAHDGLSGLRKIKLMSPSLVVSEYKLPVLSGLSILKFIRDQEQYRSIPFVFFTDHHDNTEALSLGANDWIEISSCHPEYLLDRIQYHLKLNKHGIQISRA